MNKITFEIKLLDSVNISHDDLVKLSVIIADNLPDSCLFNKGILSIDVSRESYSCISYTPKVKDKRG